MSLDARLAAPAAVCWAAAGLLIAAPDDARWWALGSWAAVVALVSIRVAGRLRRSVQPAQQPARANRSQRTHRVHAIIAGVAVCAAACAVAASAVALLQPARRPAELTSGSGTHVVSVLARVDSSPQPARAVSAFGPSQQRIQFHATASSVSTSARVTTGAMPVLVFAEGDRTSTHRLQIGASISIRGTLRAADPEDASAFLLFAAETPRVRASPQGVLAVTNWLRARFSSAAGSLPGDGGALLPGLAIGDVSAVSGPLDTAMKLSSLSHLTAVSGANCAVVIAVMMMLGGALGLGRGIRIAAALTALGGFVVLVTPGPSVMRAAVMASIVVFSSAAGRPGRGIPALCTAVIVLLIGDPWLSQNYGFALSVLATAGLLVLAPPLTRALARRMPHALAAAIALPLAAQLACQPVLILLNPSVPLYGVGANLLAEPAAPIATVLGLIACLLLPIVPGIGYGVAQLAWLPSAWIAAVARVCSSLPASQLPWLGGAAGFALMAALVLVGILAVVHVRRRRRMLQLTAIVCVLLFCGGYAGSFVGAGIGLQLTRPSHWQLAACDIGQGDAVLVRDGPAHGLVDVGPDPKPLTACLDTLGISRIDLLVLTHYDQDHVGGIDAVIGKVGTALVGQPTDARDQSIIDRLVRGGADVRVAGNGDHGTLGRLAWRVLWPNAGARTMQTGNEGSVTVSFAGLGIRSIFLGDLDERAQDALLRSGRTEPVDVVKVAHHGSADQSQQLYQALQARIALISVGADNDYGHPTTKLLRILSHTNTQAFRTDLHGMVLVAHESSGSLQVWTQRQAARTAVQQPGARTCVGCHG